MSEIVSEKRKKNIKGDGSITQRKDGLWTGRIQVGKKSNGNPDIKVVYGKTEAEAVKKLKVITNSLIKNNGVSAKKITVKKYMNEWLTKVKKYDLKPKSYDRIEQTIRLYIEPFIGSYQIGQLTPDIVQTLLNEFADGCNGKPKLSFSSIKKIYHAINDCFETGVIKKTVISNPALGVKIPGKAQQLSKKKKSEELHYYTKDEQKDLIAAATMLYKNGTPVFRLGYLIPFVLNTGIRVSELIALVWKRDIDLDKRTLNISHNMVVIKSRNDNSSTNYILIEQDSTKSVAGERTLKLNDVAYDALLNLYEVTGKNKYVISSKSGRPIAPKNIDRLMRNACIRAGFDKERIYGIHTLRHTFASMLFANGEDVKIISKLLGHSDVTTTYNIYIHLIEKYKDGALTVIDF